MQTAQVKRGSSNNNRGGGEALPGQSRAVPLSQSLKDVFFSLGMLPIFFFPFFFFLILLQEHSLGISPTWTSLVKEMRVERLRGRGTVYVINLCMALNSQKSPLVICSCLLSEPGLLREGSDKAGLLLKAILINQRQSQEKQEGVHQDECKVQLSKYGMGV